VHFWDKMFIGYILGGITIFLLGIHGMRKHNSVSLKELTMLCLIVIGWPIVLIPYGIWFIVENGDEVRVLNSYKESKRIRDAKRGFDN
jgi:hypothetical protein